MKISGAKVWDYENKFIEKDIYIAEDYISGEFETDNIIEANGLYAIPGLVDIHLHGGVGQDFCDGKEEAIQSIADFELKNGVMAICPTTMTLSEEELSNIMETLANHKNGTGADIVGINMEGPFISPYKIGAQKLDHVLSPNIDLFNRVQEKAKGLIKIVDIAPEEDNNFEFIKAVSDNVIVSLAHTCCDYNTANKAFLNGASHMTHLFNAMNGINHREPGPIISALENDATVEIIADGIHMQPSIVRMVFKLFNPNKIVLISDSMSACGLKDGEYELGGQKVTVKDSKAALTRDLNIIAGSVKTIFDCMKIAVKEMNIPLYNAVLAGSLNPAKVIGIDNKYGQLTEGYFANILLIDEDLNIKYIIKKGKVISTF